MAALTLIELSELLANLGEARFANLNAQGLALLDEEHPSPALVWALSEAAGLKLFLEGPEAALGVADRALEIGRRLGLPDSPYALEWRAAALSELGDFKGALRAYTRAIEEGSVQGIGGELCRIYHGRAVTFAQWEGPGAGLGPLRENIELSRQRGMESWELSGLCSVAGLLTDLGRWDEALLAAGAAEPRIVASGYTDRLIDLRVTVAFVAALRGDETVVEAALQWLEEHGHAEGTLPVSRAWCLATAALCRSMQGGLDDARALLVDCSDLGDPIETSVGLLGWLPFFVQASLACGDLELAVRFGSAPVAKVPRDEVGASLVSAMLAEARGEREVAADSYATAAAHAQDLAIPYEEAQALLGQGRCLLALGRAREAVLLLGRARAIFTRLGAKPALGEVDRLAPS